MAERRPEEPIHLRQKRPLVLAEVVKLLSAKLDLVLHEGVQGRRRPRTPVVAGDQLHRLLHLRERVGGCDDEEHVLLEAAEVPQDPEHEQRPFGGDAARPDAAEQRVDDHAVDGHPVGGARQRHGLDGEEDGPEKRGRRWTPGWGQPPGLCPKRSTRTRVKHTSTISRQAKRLACVKGCVGAHLRSCVYYRGHCCAWMP